MKIFNFIVEAFVFVYLTFVIFAGDIFGLGYVTNLIISLSASFLIIYFQRKSIILWVPFLVICVFLVFYLIGLSGYPDFMVKTLSILAIISIITYIVLNRKRDVYKKGCLMTGISVTLGIIVFLLSGIFIVSIQHGIGEANISLSRFYFLNSARDYYTNERSLVIFAKEKGYVPAQVSNIKKYAIKDSYIFGEYLDIQPYTRKTMKDSKQKNQYFILNFNTKERLFFKYKKDYENALKKKGISNYKYRDKIETLDITKFNMIYPIIKPVLK